MTTNRLEDLRFEADVLRHADGSIDISAHGHRAQEERLAAMHESIRDLYQAVRSVVPSFARQPAPKQTLSSKVC